MSKSNLSDQKKCPLVSIVTPAYNAMPFLAETIESVRMQKYPSVEHIIIDGGSTDGTQELLKQYPGLVWISEPDHGQSEALNKGFRRARGEIVGWLNADDTYNPGAITSAVDFLMNNPDKDIVHADVHIIDEHGSKVGSSHSRSFEVQTLLLDNPIKQPTVFMRRKVVDLLGGVNGQLRYVMDREFWLRAGVSFKFGYISGQYIANFRLCPGTKSHENNPGFRAEWLDILHAAQQDQLFRSIPHAVWNVAIRKNRAAYFFALMMQAIHQNNRKLMFQCFLSAIRLDWNLLLNRGAWMFLGRGVLGLPINRNRRFQK